MTDADCWRSAMQQPHVVDELELIVAFMQLTVFFSGDKHHGLWLNHAHTAKIHCPLHRHELTSDVDIVWLALIGTSERWILRGCSEK
jgi:hypothetical protein